MAVAPAPLVDLTTLAQVKLELGIDPSDTSQDDLLQTLITAASRFIASYCNRVLVQQPVTEKRDGSGGDRMMFCEYPVASVTSVAVNGTVINPAQGFYDVGYRFSKTQLVLNAQVFTRGAANCDLSYVAGYSPIPQDLAQVATELTMYKYKANPKLGTDGSQTIDGQSITFNAGLDLTTSMRTCLDSQYKKVIQVIAS